MRATADGCAAAAIEQALVSHIKQFSLSYEQHQLLKAREFSSLVAHLAAKRRTFTLLLACAGVGLLARSIYAFIHATPYVAWLLFGAGFGIWAFLRSRKSQRMIAALRTYEAMCESRGTTGPGQRLARDLRLCYRLSYQQHQQIHAGDAVGAAKALVAGRKANSRAFIIGSLAISVVAVALSIATGIQYIGIIPVLAIAAVLCVVRDYSVIARIRRRINSYCAEMDEVANEGGPRTEDLVAPTTMARRDERSDPYAPPSEW